MFFGDKQRSTIGENSLFHRSRGSIIYTREIKSTVTPACSLMITAPERIAFCFVLFCCGVSFLKQQGSEIISEGEKGLAYLTDDLGSSLAV